MKRRKLYRVTFTVKGSLSRGLRGLTSPKGEEPQWWRVETMVVVVEVVVDNRVDPGVRKVCLPVKRPEYK